MRLQRLLHLALALAALLSAPLARAQVTPLPKAEWKNRAPGSETATNLINRADCLDDDALITFDVEVTGTNSQQFQVWAGTGCNDVATRDMENSCMKVSNDLTPMTNTIVSLKVKDLVQTIEEDAGVDTGTVEDCSQTLEGTVARTLYFLLINPSDRVATAFGQWTFDFDMSAPGAPTGVVATPGEEAIELKFTAPAEDASTYRFYCSEVGPSANNPECGSTQLKPGEAAPATGNACGETNATGTAKGTAKGNLKNGITYAVAVTAVDKVGNVSVLSELACASPVDVTGWFEAYRAAGGEAGGGFCSFSPARQAAVPLGLALLLAGAALVRRRR